MTIKQRLFHSNLLMVSIPPLAIFTVMTILSIVLSNVLFVDLDELWAIDKSFAEVQAIVESADTKELAGDAAAQSAFMEALSGKGYRVRAEQGNKALFDNTNKREQKYMSEYMASNRIDENTQTLWVRDMDVNLVWMSLATDSEPILVIAIRSRALAVSSALGIDSMLTLATGLLAAVAFAITIIVGVGMALAGKMARNFMEPINHLTDGAQRIQAGDLSQDIPQCGGGEELEKVCASFNEMLGQLRANIEKNERYERDRREMLAGISHDLRTPLTSVKSYVKGLQDGVAQNPEKVKEYLSVIYRKSCQLEGLIDQLFLFSKLETGNLPFNFKAVNVHKYMVTLLDSLEYDFSKNSATITLNSECDAQMVDIDSEQMTRVMSNILGNSLKYNPDGGINITVTLEPSDAAVLIVIRDDGVGISETQLQRLFDSFYRGDQSRNRPTDGSGLGLSIARSIVEAHGGRIWAENDGGLAICIELPLTKEDAT